MSRINDYVPDFINLYVWAEAEVEEGGGGGLPSVQPAERTI